MIKAIATTTAAVAAALGIALSGAPANASPIPEGTPLAQFYGTCTNNYVAFWVVTDDNPATTADPVQMRVYKGNEQTMSQLMNPGDYNEDHFYLQKNGVPKTITVTADGTVIAEHTYNCGLYSQLRHHR